MAKKISVVISQGQSANPAKRKLEESLVAELLLDGSVEVAVIPHLYDLPPDSTGLLCLQGISTDMIVVSWLYPRAAHWTLDRNGIRGRVGTTQLVLDEEAEEELEDEQNAAEDSAPVEPSPAMVARGAALNRSIYAISFNAADDSQSFIDEIRRIAQEAAVKTVDLGMPPGTASTNGQNGHAQPTPNGTPKVQGITLHHLMGLPPAEDPATTDAATPAVEGPETTLQPGGPIHVDQTPDRRWYPVIDFSRCTNCMECIDFCLFGVYGTDQQESILVEQPDNCRKGCPACSRVCPENAILFPQHKSPAIAGSAVANAGGLKIDLSQLFGGPSAMEIAAKERDVELIADHRAPVGLPKRQTAAETKPADDLDRLMDQLDDSEL